MTILQSFFDQLLPSWYKSMRYRQCEGYLDRIENGVLHGWVYDRNRPDAVLSVDVYHGSTLLGRVRADLFRADLLQAGKGDGRHGFSYSLPSVVEAGTENDLRVYYAGTKYEITRPIQLIDIRKKLSRMYLKGEGIEIGALHNPLWVPAHAHVRYVDRMNLEALRTHYPELGLSRLTPVDIIDDGERLSTIADASLDFIIMNHMLEHCQNPLGTLRSHMRKLKNGGILFCTVPDMRFFRDINRSLTQFDHIVDDDQKGPEWSQQDHYREWVQHWHPEVPPQDVDVRIRELMNKNYSIHFHVWNETTFRDFIDRSRKYLDECFETETVAFNHTEIIAILRKRRHVE